MKDCQTYTNIHNVEYKLKYKNKINVYIYIKMTLAESFSVVLNKERESINITYKITVFFIAFKFAG